ncbi:MAG TPA: hypothetical protein VNE63_17450, partial [Candidatus Acidoferrales bacterium]|nr:hypothetical protein [Candidatus Acidoferrales bacterium]
RDQNCGHYRYLREATPKQASAPFLQLLEHPQAKPSTDSRASRAAEVTCGELPVDMQSNLMAAT